MAKNAVRMDMSTVMSVLDGSTLDPEQKWALATALAAAYERGERFLPLSDRGMCREFDRALAAADRRAEMDRGRGICGYSLGRALLGERDFATPAVEPAVVLLDRVVLLALGAVMAGSCWGGHLRRKTRQRPWAHYPR